MFNSELVQKVIVGSVAVSAMVSIMMLVGSFAQATPVRSIASVVQDQTLSVQSIRDVPECDQLLELGVEYIETVEDMEWTTEELCN